MVCLHVLNECVGTVGGARSHKPRRKIWRKWHSVRDRKSGRQQLKSLRASFQLSHVPKGGTAAMQEFVNFVLGCVSYVGTSVIDSDGLGRAD